jgi:hypothetical protein
VRVNPNDQDPNSKLGNPKSQAPNSNQLPTNQEANYNRLGRIGALVLLEFGWDLGFGV